MINGYAINGRRINGKPASDEAAFQSWLRDPGSPVIHLVEIGYHGTSAAYPDWDPFLLRLSDFPYPPASVSCKPYRDVVKSLPSFRRQIGEDLTGSVAASLGSIVLDNENGDLDLWHNLSLDGQRVRVFQGHPEWARENFRLMMECIAEQPDSATQDALTIRLRGIERGADLPIQTELVPASTFSNASSNQPVPLSFGRPFNITPVCIDDVNQVYQFHDGAGKAVSAARDGGYPFQTAQIAISAVNAGTDTLSTASAHGFYKNTRARCDIGTMPTQSDWYRAAWNGVIVVAITLSTQASAYSVDGIKWTAGASPGMNVGDIGWNGRVFCVTPNNQDLVAISPDAKSWTLGTMPSSGFWYGIAWNGDVFVALKYNSAVAATSPDGLNWTAQVLPSTEYWWKVVWNGQVFCAIQQGSNACATSPDGITWTARTLPSSATWSGLVWNGQIFCATAANGSDKAATSPDGITWTARTLPSADDWSLLAWSGSVFCAVAQNSSNKAATSPDGITWTARTMPATKNWNALIWIGNVFVCMDDFGLVTVSSDGITWSPVTNTLPAPLAINTDYWVSPDGLTSTDFRLCATRGGTTINITGTDTGAPLVGFHWTPDLAAGKVYLDSKPSGALTLDVVAGDDLAADILPDVLGTPNVHGVSQAAFRTTCAQPLGIYIRERRNRLDVANEIVRGLGAWYGYDRNGALRFGRVEASYSSHNFAIVEADMELGDLKMERFLRPRKQHRVKFRRNWTDQAGTLVAGVSAEQRFLFSNDYSVSMPQPLGDDEGSDGSEYHLLAVMPDAIPSLMAFGSDAYDEAGRLNTLYYGWGAIVACTVGRLGSRVEIGHVGKVTHSRFGLSGGVRMQVIDIEDRPSEDKTVLRFFYPLAAYSPGQL